jgi:hypothetical protein
VTSLRASKVVSFWEKSVGERPVAVKVRLVDEIGSSQAFTAPLDQVIVWLRRLLVLTA